MNNEIQKFDFKGRVIAHLDRRGGGSVVRRQGPDVLHPPVLPPAVVGSGCVMDDKEVFAALAAALKPMNTTKDIADNCGIKEGTLAYWRSAGIGPKFVKVGRTVMYPKEQMIAYFAQHLYQCTAEYEEEVGA